MAWFGNLSGIDFEEICKRLFESQGYDVEALSARARSAGADMVVRNSDGAEEAVGIAHASSGRMYIHEIRKKASDIARVASLLEIEKATLIVSVEVPKDIENSILIENNIRLLDGSWVDKEIAARSAIDKFMLDAMKKQKDEQRLLIKDRSDELADLLDSLAPGRDDWREYEVLAVDVLNYLFIPSLGAPRIQDRTEDGLDIRDAIYPISAKDKFWGEVRTNFMSRSVVAEFKNLSSEPGQREVESIQQYLYSKAMRTFGLLCS